MAANGPVRLAHITGPSSGVQYGNWYNENTLPEGAKKMDEGGWRFVARAINQQDRATMAAGAMAVYKKYIEQSSPRLIYYTQNKYDRRELFDWVAQGNPISSISSPKGCDCSSMVCAVVRLITDKAYIVHTGGGRDDAGNWTSAESGLISMFKKTGKFEILTDSSYISQSSKLLAGDILVKPKWYISSSGDDTGGHAATVVYSEYDDTTQEYVNEPIEDRAQNAGRVTIDFNFASFGPRRGFPYPPPQEPVPVPTDAPTDFAGLSDFELFMLGAFITGGKALAVASPGGSSISFSEE